MFWLARKPTNARRWDAQTAVLPRIERAGCDRVLVHGVRCFRYRSVSDFDIAYEDRTYRLETLDRLDFFVSPFGGIGGLRRDGGKAHTFVSFGFGDEYLAVSIEVRRVEGQRYSALRGLFRAFELLYVFGDERDVVGLRTAFTRSPVYRFPIATTASSMVKMFLGMAERANRLRDKPEFYNTLTNTCTTNLVQHVNSIAPGRIPWTPHVLLPGYAPRLLYRLGLVRTTLSYEDMLTQARIDDAAGRDVDSADFSQRIREKGLGTGADTAATSPGA